MCISTYVILFIIIMLHDLNYFNLRFIIFKLLEIISENIYSVLEI